MVGGPGITFATSTAVGNADAVTRFLLANAGTECRYFGYSESIAELHRIVIRRFRSQCIVISEGATCDRRERVCVLFLATPNTSALYLDTLESVTGRTSGCEPSEA